MSVHVYSVEGIGLCGALGKQMPSTVLSSKQLLPHLLWRDAVYTWGESMAKYHSCSDVGIQILSPSLLPSLQQKLVKLLINVSWSFLSCEYDCSGTIA